MVKIPGLARPRLPAMPTVSAGSHAGGREPRVGASAEEEEHEVDEEAPMLGSSQAGLRRRAVSPMKR